jgi:hypothetical protein
VGLVPREWKVKVVVVLGSLAVVVCWRLVMREVLAPSGFVGHEILFAFRWRFVLQVFVGRGAQTSPVSMRWPLWMSFLMWLLGEVSEPRRCQALL